MAWAAAASPTPPDFSPPALSRFPPRPRTPRRSRPRPPPARSHASDAQPAPRLGEGEREDRATPPLPPSTTAPTSPSTTTPTTTHTPTQPPTFEDVSTAAFRIREHTARTHCHRSEALSAATGVELYLKHEHKQRTGSFKERGACYALLTLSAEERAAGITAASAGNHALALAAHAGALGLEAHVVMPTTAPLTKIARCRSLGADVVLHGETIADAAEYAREHFVSRGCKYVNGFDDPAIIAGAGTVGLELLEQVKDLDYIVVPAGGGGLLAGILLAAKTLAPAVKVVGVEPERCASLSAALAAGEPTLLEVPGPTLADGLAVPCVGPTSFEVIRPLVDDVVTVSEQVREKRAPPSGSLRGGMAGRTRGEEEPPPHAPTPPPPSRPWRESLTTTGAVASAPSFPPPHPHPHPTPPPSLSWLAPATQDIAVAVLRLMETERIVQEGAGAAGLAAVLAGRIPGLAGKRVGVPLCGANIDSTVLGRVIDRALVYDSRLVRFSAVVSDRCARATLAAGRWPLAAGRWPLAANR